MINQLAIEFNNKGVAFFECGRLKDAISMFLGSTQVMLKSVASEESHYHNERRGYNNKYIELAIKKLSLPIDEGRGSSIVLTEDKCNSSLSSNAFRLPQEKMAFESDRDEFHHQQVLLYSAVILYNTALTHHLSNKGRQSLQAAINLYEKACNLIADIQDVNNNLASLLIVAMMNNMIHLYHDLQQYDMASTYLDYFKDYVASQPFLDQANSRPENLIRGNNIDITEMLLVATLTVSYPPVGTGAA